MNASVPLHRLAVVALLVVAPLVLGSVDSPNVVAVHWTGSGAPDRSMHVVLTALVLAAIAVGIVVLASGRAPSVFVAAVVGILFGASAFIAAENLGVGDWREARGSMATMVVVVGVCAVAGAAVVTIARRRRGSG